MAKKQTGRKGDISGMTKVFMGSKWRTIFFWALILILAFLTIRDVYRLVYQYYQGEKEADMGFVFNTTMTMPNFTFCVPISMVNSIFNSSKFKSKADFGGKISDSDAVKKSLASMKTKNVFLSKEWDRQTIHDAVRVIGVLHSFEREADDAFIARDIKSLQKQEKKNHRLKSINLWKNEIHKRNITFKEFMQKVGSEVLRRMIKRSIRISPLDDTRYKSDFKITWISEGNLCFQPTFDEKGNDDIKTPGNFYNLQLHHDPDTFEDDINCIVIDLNGRPADMSRFLGSGGSTKDGVNEEICPGTVSDLIAEIRATYEMLENDDGGTACMDFEDDKDSSEFNCRSRCRMEFIRSLCKCFPITTEELIDPDELKEYPICDYSKCKLDDQSHQHSENDCVNKCRRSCKQLRYKINLVGSKESTIRGESSDDISRALYQTQVNLGWGSFEFFQLEQNYKWDSIENFFSDVGGAIGIWLGLSVLSLIQGIGYIVQLMSGKCIGENDEDEEEDAYVQQEVDDRKFSINPIGPSTLSSNPFGDIAEPRKGSKSSGP